MNDQIGIRPNILLDDDQMEMIEGYATGKTASQIGRDLEMTPADIMSLELDTRARLGAKSTPHMMRRAWQMGILFNRFLCLVLCISMTSQILITPDSKFIARPARIGSRIIRIRRD